MSDASFVFIAGVFVLAGFVKGLIGLGLPTVSMGLAAISALIKVTSPRTGLSARSG